MISKFKLKFLFTVVFTAQLAFAQNPIVVNEGMSDPHARVFNNKIYLYTGHDDSPTDPLWVMKDWRVYSTTDLINWELESTISPKDNYMDDNSTSCWASDAATQNGKYYFYFSDRDRSTGVMESNSPTGPFVDKRGSALFGLHDPTVIEENGTHYIIFGNKESSYQIAKLNNDMSSLGETPKKIVINGSQWAAAPKWQDKNYVFKHNGIFYLSWGTDYATSTNIYGPYTCQGSVGQGYKLDAFAHGSFFWWKGQFYHVWCYYINNAYKYRESIITYCHFTDDGKIVTDTKFLDAHFANGVGQYNANWPTIEAEWFYEKSAGIAKKDGPNNGFALENINDGDFVVFPNINGLNTAKKITFNVQRNNATTIEVRKGSKTGALLATCNVEASTSNLYVDVSCNLPAQSSNTSLCFVFKGSGNNLLKFNEFSFSEGTSSSQTPYSGVINIPGTIQAENYDNGGEGVSYHDVTSGNTGNTYRNDNVDLGTIEGGGYCTGWSSDGEWQEYTINVANSGNYNFEFIYSSGKVGAKIGAEIIGGNMLISSFDLPQTQNGWIDYDPLSKDNIFLSSGTAVLRINTVKSGFNLDKINITSITSNQNVIVHMQKANADGFAIDGGNGGADKQAVKLWTNSFTNANQQWIEIDRGNGYYSYQKVNTDFCIDGGNGGTDRQLVYLYTCDANQQNQQWLKVSAGSGKYRLQKRNASDFSIDGGYGGAINVQLRLKANSDTNQNQQWIFSSVSALKSGTLLNEEAMNPETNSNNLVVYPNPSTDGVFQVSEICDWSVYSTSGAKLLVGNDAIVDLSSYPKGIYVFKTKNTFLKLMVK